MTRGILFVLAFSVITGLLVGGVIAGGGMSGGALESTQLMNHAELITQVSQLAEQINNQIQMIQDMITNTLTLPKRLIGSVMGTVNKVMGAYNQIQGVLGRLSNLDEEFYNLFYSSLQEGLAGADSEWLKNYSEEYYELSKGMEKQAKKTLESLKISAEDINDSSKLLEDLANNASSASGRNAIMQASNELLGFMGGELIKVRTLLAEQTKTYLDYAERKRTIEDAAQERMRQDLEKWTPGPEASQAEDFSFSF